MRKIQQKETDITMKYLLLGFCFKCDKISHSKHVHTAGIISLLRYSIFG